MAYRHDGFFYAMDTYREYQALNELWDSGEAPWKVWGRAVMSSFWRDRPTLVTGATGLVGGWLVRRPGRGRRRRRLPGPRLGPAERAGPQRA